LDWMRVGRRLFLFGVGHIPPEPTERIGQQRAAMFAVVPAVAELEFVIVAHEFQAGGHLLVRQWPVAVEVVEIICSVLKKNADGLLLRFADERSRSEEDARGCASGIISRRRMAG